MDKREEDSSSPKIMLILEIIIRDHSKKRQLRGLQQYRRGTHNMQSACLSALADYISAKNFGIEKPVMCIMRWRATRIVMK